MFGYKRTNELSDCPAQEKLLMGLFDAFKKIVAPAQPESLGSMPAAISSTAAELPKAGMTEKEKVAYFDADIPAIRERAEAIQRVFNESLNIANLSKEKGIREYRVTLAREKFAELKTLADRFPFLNITNLPDVEASIVAVATETRSMSYGVATGSAESEVSGHPKLLPSAPVIVERASAGSFGHGASDSSSADGRVLLMSVQSYFRVINESIEIARTSKNMDTKKSRIRVARSRLAEARQMITQYKLQVDGADRAEAEIERIEAAIRSGAPTESAYASITEENDEFLSPARRLLKEATKLKKEKKFPEACEKLREAYSAEGGEILMIEERLRLPMYLQLAGRNDEGWAELNRLLAKYVGPFDQLRTTAQMEIFLRKEKNETATHPLRVIAQVGKEPIPATGVATCRTIQKILDGNFTEADVLSGAASLWKKDDVITGLKFCATMHLDTPLQVLLRHGEVHSDETKPPPRRTLKPNQGIWIPTFKTYRELGVDIPEPTDYQHATEIGPAYPSEYIPFLIAVRRIAEAPESLECRRVMLREMSLEAGWEKFLSKHGGIEAVAARVLR